MKHNKVMHFTNLLASSIGITDKLYPGFVASDNISLKQPLLFYFTHTT